MTAAPQSSETIRLAHNIEDAVQRSLDFHGVKTGARPLIEFRSITANARECPACETANYWTESNRCNECGFQSHPTAWTFFAAGAPVVDPEIVADIGTRLADPGLTPPVRFATCTAERPFASMLRS